MVTTQGIKLLGPVEGDDCHSVLVSNRDFLCCGTHFCVVVWLLSAGQNQLLCDCERMKCKQVVVIQKECCFVVLLCYLFNGYLENS